MTDSSMIWGESTYVSDFGPVCPCGNPGTVSVDWHPVGHCGGEWELMEGAWLCAPCFQTDLRATQDMLFNIFLGLMDDECECGRPMGTLGDVYARVLYAGTDEP